MANEEKIETIYIDTTYGRARALIAVDRTEPECPTFQVLDCELIHWNTPVQVDQLILHAIRAILTSRN